MRAFTDTPVSKDQLLASLGHHQEMDNFRPGHFWEGKTGTGCGVGCTIHDFAPGQESEHDQYEILFGIPAELAVLEDHIFEMMHSAVHRPRWPIEFVLSVTEGANLDRAVGRWLQLLLDSGESPMYAERHTTHVQAARHLLNDWMTTGTMDPATQRHLAQALASATEDTDPYALNIADLLLDYVQKRTKTEPYTLSDMHTLSSISAQAALEHSENHGPTAAQDFRNAEAEGIYRISRLLLRAMAEQA